MAVFYDLRVKIPSERITINRGDNNRVLYVLEAPYDSKKGYPVPKRVTIGRVCKDSTTEMHPTTKFKDLFPNEWSLLKQKPAMPMLKKIGLYCAVKAVDRKTDIIDLTQKAFGFETSQALLDFAMFSILHRSAAASQFTASMSDQMLFSSVCRSDSYYSDLFKTKISESSIIAFKKSWAHKCKESGAEKVWLCIDGSNDDCESAGVEIAEKGHAKSHKNINIVSFTYAVTESGLPVTFDVYRGGLVDSKAMKSIIDFLSEAGICIRGVILDRGYCNAKTLDYLIQNNIPYTIMVKGTPQGVNKIIAEYGEKIKMNTECFIKGTTLFGIQKPFQIFKDFVHQDYLTLFYDYKNAGDRITTLIGHVNKELQRLHEALTNYTENLKKYNKRLAAAKEKKEDKPVPPELPKVSVSMKKYVYLRHVKESVYEPEIIKKNLQNDINEKGLYNILSSEKLEPKQIADLYTSRTSSEIQYKIIKTELGYGQVRIHYTTSLYAKFALGFIATIIRYQFQCYARGISRNTSDIIRELNLISAIKINDVYTHSHTENERQLNFFNFFDCDESLIDECIKEENNRIAGRLPTPRHRKTGVKPGKKTTNAKYSKQEQKTDANNESDIVKSDNQDTANKIDSVSQPEISQETLGNKSEPKKRGVKPGTKRGDFNKDGSPRKKPGVPQGTHRGEFKKNGDLRQKPGPKSKSDASPKMGE